VKPLVFFGITNQGLVTRCAGTPGFASPEAISSKKNLFDKSSDVFSLACIVVHMITGKPPYVAEAEEKEGDVLVVMHH
jgi:serine/threonine protein kinase